jgi:hypothetical protein
MTAIHMSRCVLPQDDERLHIESGQIGGDEELKGLFGLGGIL